MADIKITDLAAYPSPTSPSTDVLEIVDVTANANKKITPNQLGYAASKNVLVAGSNITINPNDINNTLTIASTGGGTGISVPVLNFVASATASSGQVFTNTNLSEYTSADQLSVTVNGGTLNRSNYTLSGTNLTITAFLPSGAVVQVQPANAGGGGGGGGSAGTNWSSPATIEVNDIVYGLSPLSTAVNAGSTVGFDGSNIGGTEFIATQTPINAIGAIAFGNSLFVAINTFSAVTPICFSSDGINWTSVTYSAISAQWFGITYGNGLFVIVGNSGLCLTSSDAITWTQRSMPATTSWKNIAYGNNLFVATVGGSSSSVAATSPDGINWTQRALPVSAVWTNVSFVNNVFMLVAENTATAYTSPDGVTWTARTLPVTRTWRGSAYGSGVYVLISTSSSTCATSIDLVNWNLNTIGNTANWGSIIFAAGIFLAVDSSITKLGAVSANGLQWSNTTLPTASPWTGIAFGNRTFVVVSQDLATPSACAISLATKNLFVFDSEGMNPQPAANGTYRCLGGGREELGLWVRTA